MKNHLLFVFIFSSFVLTVFSQGDVPLPPPIEVVEGPSDIEPTFPGGQDAIMRFIQENINYPSEAIEEGIQGKVYVQFYVEKDGKVSDVKILKGLGCPSIEKEAIRVVSIMPNWIPGTTDTALLERTVMNLPISFALGGDDFDDDFDDKVKHQAHWAAFDFGYITLRNVDAITGKAFGTNFSTTPYWNVNPATSVVFNFNFLEYKLPIFRQYLGLTTGLGAGISSLGFRDNYSIIHTKDTIYAEISTAGKFKQNTLSSYTLSIPLLLEFSTKERKKKSIYFSAGVIGSYRYSSVTYQAGKDDQGDRYRNYLYSRFNMRNFLLDGTVRAGWDAFGLFASYSLTPLFQKQATMAVYPLKFGLTFNIDYLK